MALWPFQQREGGRLEESDPLNDADPDCPDDPDTAGSMAERSVRRAIKILKAWMERIGAPLEVARPGEE